MVFLQERTQVFEDAPLATWSVAGFVFAFPVLSVQESGGNRIIVRDRPYRDGAKLDDTGATAKRWTLEVLFENSIAEPDMVIVNNGVDLYPNVLNELINQFDIHETGDLQLPTIGVRRVRAESYSRAEKFDERDCANVSLVFVEDNEDNVNSASIQPVTVNANGKRLAQLAEFDMQSDGAWDQEAAGGLITTLNNLEDLSNAPGNVAQDIQQAAFRAQGLSKRTFDLFSKPTKDGRDLFNEPSGNRSERKLVSATELSRRGAVIPRHGRPPQITVVFGTDQSLFSIGAIISQDVADLIEINPELDPFFVPAGTHVNVFATEAFLNGSSTAA